MTLDLPAIQTIAREAKARADAATPVKDWKVSTYYRDGSWASGPYHRCERETKRDVAFIRAARTDVPALASLVEELVAEVARVRAETIEECASALEKFLCGDDKSGKPCPCADCSNTHFDAGVIRDLAAKGER